MTDSTPDFEQQRIADHADHQRLVAIAQARHPGVESWWCIWPGNAECHICDEVGIETLVAVNEHRVRHLAELDQTGGQQ